jgi:hypothetical protein
MLHCCLTFPRVIFSQVVQTTCILPGFNFFLPGVYCTNECGSKESNIQLVNLHATGYPRS